MLVGRVSVIPQIEYNQSIIAANASIIRLQILVQAGVKVQPPKGRPGEYDMTHAAFARLLKVVNGVLIVYRNFGIGAIVLGQSNGFTRWKP